MALICLVEYLEMLSLLLDLLLIGPYLVTAWILICCFLILMSDADLRLLFATKFGKQPENLARKVVWVTGASSGIGEHIAYCLAQAGVRLILSARRSEELERVKSACVAKGKVSESDVMILQLDVTKLDTHKAAVDQVIEHFGQIDVLLNNAGKGQRAAWMDVSLSVDREMFEVNVFGQVSLTQEVLPHMISRKSGTIAVMSSMAGKFGAQLSRSYTGSKHALNGYFDCLRTEMGEHNVGVTVICPGPVFSNLFKDAATGKPGESVGREMKADEKRISSERCAYLTCVAIANNLYEVWISKNPILFMCYINQLIPDLSKWFTLRYGMKMLMKMREGKL